VRDARHRVDGPIVDHQPDPGRSAAVVGQRRRALGQVGLHEVARRHLPAEGRVTVTQSLHQSRLTAQRDAGESGHRITGQVVVRRPETSRDDDGVRDRQRVAQRCRDDVDLVPDDDAAAHVDAGIGQPPAEPGGVAVDDVAEQQLGADGQQVDPHRVVRRAASRCARLRAVRSLPRRNVQARAM